MKNALGVMEKRLRRIVEGLRDRRNVPTVAAHCVYATEEELEIFGAEGVTVALNPVSNMKLDSGICNGGRLLREGVKVAVGTDSVASNNNGHNFVEEMKLMAIGGKIAADDPTAVTPEEVIRAATLGGAKAQGRGRLRCAEGRQSCRSDRDGSFDTDLHPVHNMVNNIVYSASGSDILMTMINEKWYMKTVITVQ